jgi:hypothetical protein
LSPSLWTTRGAEIARDDESRVANAIFSAFLPWGKKRRREVEGERARRAASRLDGGGKGGDGAARRGAERERRWE